ncbi:hypothetical protein [Filimonas effusa]|uniref:Uncharacterized protein n=1 Tax=Filimonas effusa TaxID=2508721 RepID=A0A4Q1DCQ3_9BACT|nr:hypothetical protein [Filimonas effusa]RXK86748.1 hypothetical protein ESB13_08085 [Filimonas effusa]
MADVIKMVSGKQFDYACSAFMGTFEVEGNVYYASFCPEAVAYNESIQVTGRYIITMLHPKLASVVFYLRNYKGKWVLDKPATPGCDESALQCLFVTRYPFELDDKIIDWCSEQIGARSI